MKIIYLAEFVVFYIYSLFKANLRLAWDIITPGIPFMPGIVRVPVDFKTNTGLMAFANLVSMTPGTLTMYISEDKKMVYIHSLYLKDKKIFRNIIKNDFEKRIKKIWK